MALDKLNLFTQTSQMKPLTSLKEVGGQSSGGVAGSSTSNCTRGKTAGINEAMNGQSVFTQAQAGIAAGEAGKKINLIA